MSRLSTTIDQLENPTPGEILLTGFMEPMKLSQNRLARAIGVPPRRINEIVLGKRAITADHDLMERRRVIAGDLERIEPIPHVA